MYDKNLLKNYARLVYKVGVNLQNGQGLEIACPVELYKIAEIFTETAYESGAGIVNVRWIDQKTDKLKYLHADFDLLQKIPKWQVSSKEYLLDNDFCYVAIDADDPNAFSSVPSQRLGAYVKAKSKAFKKFSDGVMANAIRWCVVSVPSKNWAKLVFPKEKNPEKRLFSEIVKTMRLDTPDPVAEWEKHVQTLEKRATYLNDKRFYALRFKSGNGTDLTVGLCDDHVWLSAREKARDGVYFVANMPTEEVFTAPHNKRINGVVKSALPLCYNGNKIEDFTLTFKDGKIIDFTAEKGYSTLKELIATDDGTLSLGEVALIGKNSPIAKSGILFYNTLFDENASCHLAIGKSYPTNVRNGENLTDGQLEQKGANDSHEHVDFMIGTKDLSVTGIACDGQETVIFSDGEWAI